MSTIYMHMALQRKYIQMYHMVELYTYCSMDKQYMEGVQKWIKGHLMSLGNGAMWIYHSLARSETTSLQFKELGQIEVKNGFLRLSHNSVWCL